MSRELPAESPAVHVYIDSSRAGTAVVMELLAGLEEEGIPGKVQVVAATPAGTVPLTATGLALAAARTSVLEVGLGMDARGELALHHQRAPESMPVFVAPGGSVDGLVARAFGVNAARLVKVQPLRLPSTESGER